MKYLLCGISDLHRLTGLSLVVLLVSRTCVGDFTLNSCTSLSPEPPLSESPSPAPVTVSLSSTQFYTRKQDITVTLSANSGDMKDFIVQARQIDSGTEPFGSFEAGSSVATLTCSSADDTAINADESTKTSVTLTWTPPKTAGGRVYFVASIVDSSDNFWSTISSNVINPDYEKSYIYINVGTDIPWSSTWSNEKSDQVSNLINSVESQLEQEIWPPYVTKVRVLGVSNDGNTITINLRADLKKNYPTVWDEAVIGTKVWEWSVQPILPGGGSVTSVQQKSTYATSPDGYVIITGPCSLLDTALVCEKTGHVCSSVSLQPACVCPPRNPFCDDSPVGSGEGNATRRGTCPKPSSSCDSNLKLCQDHYDCPMEELCCTNACGGKECMDAVDTPANVPIRLRSGGYNNGRVEIRYDKEWRTVCAPNNIDDYTINVMCKQLKFGGAGVSVTPVKDAYPETGSYIWLKDVQCAGSESHVGECESEGWGNVDSCTHDEDVGLFCDITDDTICFSFVIGLPWIDAYSDVTSTEYATISQNIEDMVVAAATDSERTATSAEVAKLSNSGGNVKAEICITYDSALTPPDQTEAAISFGNNMAGGLTLPLGGTPVTITDLNFNYDIEDPLNVPINGNTKVCDIYDAMSICQHSGICIDQNGTPACSCRGNYTGDFCITQEAPEELTVTLRSPAYAYGVLEVTAPDGTKSAVCDTFWTDENSDVVCRQLGFPEGGTRVFLANVTYASSTRLDYVQCDGTEKNIGWCSKPEFQDYTCPDENQVVILCDDKTDALKYGLTLTDDFNPNLNDSTSQEYKDLKDKIENEVKPVYGNNATVRVIGFDSNNGKAKAIVEVTYPDNKQLDPTQQSKEALGLHYALIKSNTITGTELIVDNVRNDKTVTMPIEDTTNLCELFKEKLSCLNGAVCQVVDNYPVCSCPIGYNGTDCSQDINECSDSSLNDCAQICTNTVGSYTCSCEDGYRSIDNGRTCDYDSLEIQLADGSAFGGELQVSNRDSWGTVCLDHFTMVDAHVACRQLGKLPFTVFDAGPILPKNTVPQTISYLNCVGTEDNINKCPRSVWGDTTCSSGKKVGLICRDTKREIPVQLQLDLQWQTSKYTDNNDPDVKQLKQDISKIISEIMNTFNKTGNSAATFSNLVENDFEEYGGKATMNLDVVFKNEIDLEEQAVLGLFLVNELKKMNNLIPRADSSHVPIINVLMVTDTAAGPNMQVLATQASDQCFLLDAKQGCLSGGKCMVNRGGDAVCNCLATRNDRGGTYCQLVTDPRSPTATNVTADHLHVLAYRLDLDWVQQYFNSRATVTMMLMENLIVMSDSLYNSNNFYPTSTIVSNLQPGSVDATISATFDNILTPALQTKMAAAIGDTIANLGYQVPFNDTLVELLGPLRIIYEGPFLGTVEEVPVVTTCSVYDDRDLCMRGGYCVSRTNFTPTCVCVSGYSGEFCEFDPEERQSPSTPNVETRRLLIIILCVIGGILLLFAILLGALLCNHRRNRTLHESSISDSDSDVYSSRSFTAVRPNYGYGFGPASNTYGTIGVRRAMQTRWLPQYWGTTAEEPGYLVASSDNAFDEAYNYTRGDMNYPWGRPAVMASRGIHGGADNVLRRHSALNERDYF